jgi:hypothetical protein
MLALANMTDFFVDEFARLRRRRFALALVGTCAPNGFLLRH